MKEWDETPDETTEWSRQPTVKRTQNNDSEYDTQFQKKDRWNIGKVQKVFNRQLEELKKKQN